MPIQELLNKMVLRISEEILQKGEVPSGDRITYCAGDLVAMTPDLSEYDEIDESIKNKSMDQVEKMIMNKVFERLKGIDLSDHHFKDLSFKDKYSALEKVFLIGGVFDRWSNDPRTLKDNRQRLMNMLDLYEVDFSAPNVFVYVSEDEDSSSKQVTTLTQESDEDKNDFLYIFDQEGEILYDDEDDERPIKATGEEVHITNEELESLGMLNDLFELFKAGKKLRDNEKTASYLIKMMKPNCLDGGSTWELSHIIEDLEHLGVFAERLSKEEISVASKMKLYSLSNQVSDNSPLREILLSFRKDVISKISRVKVHDLGALRVAMLDENVPRNKKTSIVKKLDRSDRFSYSLIANLEQDHQLDILSSIGRSDGDSYLSAQKENIDLAKFITSMDDDLCDYLRWDDPGFEDKYGRPAHRCLINLIESGSDSMAVSVYNKLYGHNVKSVSDILNRMMDESRGEYGDPDANVSWSTEYPRIFELSFGLFNARDKMGMGFSKWLKYAEEDLNNSFDDIIPLIPDSMFGQVFARYILSRGSESQKSEIKETYIKEPMSLEKSTFDLVFSKEEKEKIAMESFNTSTPAVLRGQLPMIGEYLPEDVQRETFNKIASTVDGAKMIISKKSISAKIRDKAIKKALKSKTIPFDFIIDNTTKEEIFSIATSVKIDSETSGKIITKYEDTDLAEKIIKKNGFDIIFLLNSFVRDNIDQMRIDPDEYSEVIANYMNDRGRYLHKIRIEDLTHSQIYKENIPKIREKIGEKDLESLSERILKDLGPDKLIQMLGDYEGKFLKEYNKAESSKLTAESLEFLVENGLLESYLEKNGATQEDKRIISKQMDSNENSGRSVFSNKMTFLLDNHTYKIMSKYFDEDRDLEIYPENILIRIVVYLAFEDKLSYKKAIKIIKDKTGSSRQFFEAANDHFLSSDKEEELNNIGMEMSREGLLSNEELISYFKSTDRLENQVQSSVVTLLNDEEDELSMMVLSRYIQRSSDLVYALKFATTRAQVDTIHRVYWSNGGARGEPFYGGAKIFIMFEDSNINVDDLFLDAYKSFIKSKKGGYEKSEAFLSKRPRLLKENIENIIDVAQGTSDAEFKRVAKVLIDMDLSGVKGQVFSILKRGDNLGMAKKILGDKLSEDDIKKEILRTDNPNAAREMMSLLKDSTLLNDKELVDKLLDELGFGASLLSRAGKVSENNLHIYSRVIMGEGTRLSFTGEIKLSHVMFVVENGTMNPGRLDFDATLKKIKGLNAQDEDLNHFLYEYIKPYIEINKSVGVINLKEGTFCGEDIEINLNRPDVRVMAEDAGFTDLLETVREFKIDRKLNAQISINNGRINILVEIENEDEGDNEFDSLLSDNMKKEMDELKVKFDDIVGKMSMDSPFGIEIEYSSTIPRSQFAKIVSGDSGESVVAYDDYKSTTGSDWEVKYDGSISTGIPAEVASPKLYGEEGIEKLRKVLKGIDSLNKKKKIKTGAEIQCGIHVHHDIKDLLNIESDLKEVFKKALFKVQGPIYELCHESRKSGSYSRKMGVHSVKGDHLPSSKDGFNFTRYGTLEFRMKEGVMDADEIVRWVRVTKMVVEGIRETILKSSEDNINEVLEAITLERIMIEKSGRKGYGPLDGLKGQVSLTRSLKAS